MSPENTPQERVKEAVRIAHHLADEMREMDGSAIELRSWPTAAAFVAAFPHDERWYDEEGE